MVFKPEEVFWPPEIDDLVLAPGRGQVGLQQVVLGVSLRPHAFIWPCTAVSALIAVSRLVGRFPCLRVAGVL